jgi:hypothetical protein
VKQNPEKEIATEVIAESIVAISDGIKKLRAGRLNDRALVLLLHDVTGVARRDIKVVLDGLQSLESTYIKKRPA